MTYAEKSTQLALDASIAVFVLANAECDDLEFLPLKPRHMSPVEIAQLAARWHGRGLRSVGVIGLCGIETRTVFKEPLEPEQGSALAAAFLAHLQVLFSQSFEEQRPNVEVAELERLHALQDPRET
jgi:hypothetical protein